MRAVLLYARMSREGFLPSALLRTLMYIVKMAELVPDQDTLLHVISQAFQNTSLAEHDFMTLLQILKEGLSAPPPFIDHTIDAFLATRPPDYALSDVASQQIMKMHLHAGDPQRAKRWYVHSPLSTPPRSSQSDASPSPYASLLRDLSKEDQAFCEYEAAWERVKAEIPSLVLGVDFLNALISKEIARERYHAVFAIYHRMMAARSAPTTPDATTFYHVFRAINRLTSLARRRHSRGRRSRARPPANMPHPRAVYRDMLACHAEHVRARPLAASPVLKPFAVHRALRTFMGRHDYPAAYIVLRGFLYHADQTGPVGAAAQRIVVNALLDRIGSEMPRLALYEGQSAVWAFRFLGLGEVPRYLRAEVVRDGRMAWRVRAMGAEPRLGLGFVDWDCEEEGEDGRAEAGRAGNADGTVERVRLERILRRAILASFEETDVVDVRDVSEVVREAKREMVPGRDKVA
ncbi:hypothetical protein C8Q76DRAFT_760593 [Earliella scabrosa]|nr:hypothetical protein C8Q76DRAFT_760593 [Earliella scabrosa]